MVTTPSVSIVIPAYNVEEWIIETLKSVNQQTYDHRMMEIVLIDDGSTDATVERATSIFNEGDIVWNIIQTSNNGSSGARNIGWQRAKGEWIQFLDSDDLLKPYKIMHQVEALYKLNENVAVVYSPWQRFAATNGIWQASGQVNMPSIHKDILFDLLKTENFIATGSQLFRRKWLEAVGGYDKRYEPIEDVNLLLRIAIAGGQFNPAFAQEPLFYYRQRPGSLSKRNQSKFLEGCVGNAQVAEDYWRKNDNLTPEHSKLLSSIYFQAARHFASADKNRFAQLTQQIDTLIPNFVPDSPLHLRLVAKILGYRKAEKVAIKWQRLKKVLLHNNQY